MRPGQPWDPPNPLHSEPRTGYIKKGTSYSLLHSYEFFTTRIVKTYFLCRGSIRRKWGLAMLKELCAKIYILQEGVNTNTFHFAAIALTAISIFWKTLETSFLLTSRYLEEQEDLRAGFWKTYKTFKTRDMHVTCNPTQCGLREQWPISPFGGKVSVVKKMALSSFCISKWYRKLQKVAP